MKKPYNHPARDSPNKSFEFIWCWCCGPRVHYLEITVPAMLFVVLYMLSSQFKSSHKRIYRVTMNNSETGKISLTL